MQIFDLREEIKIINQSVNQSMTFFSAMTLNNGLFKPDAPTSI